MIAFVLPKTIDAAMVEEIAEGKHPALEEQLVQIARRDPQSLKGVVIKPPRYSASSIQNFADCERKFYWPTVAGLDTAATESQKFGTKLHLYAERWLRDRIDPPNTDEAGRLLHVGLAALPKPGTPGMMVEEKFELKVPGLSVVITGTKDLVIRPQEKDATSFQLWDHKTMKSVRYFGEKTKPWLSGNIQANVYAFAEWAKLAELGFDNLRVVDKRWPYYFRREKQVEVLRVVDDLGHVRQRFEQDAVPLVRRMVAIAEERPRASDVPQADESVCEAYGGCGHRARCFGYGLTTENKMGILAGKFGKAAISAKVNQAQGAGTAINPPAPKPWTPPAQENNAPELAALQDEEQQEEAAAPPPPKKAAKPKGATAKVAAVAEQTEKAFAPRAGKGKDLRTPGTNPAHNYWLCLGARPTFGFEAEIHDVDRIVGTAQANATATSGKDHFRQEFGGHALLEAAFASWMEENAIEGAVHVPADMSTAAKDVVGLLRAHAALVIE